MLFREPVIQDSFGQGDASRQQASGDALKASGWIAQEVGQGDDARAEFGTDAFEDFKRGADYVEGAHRVLFFYAIFPVANSCSRYSYTYAVLCENRPVRRFVSLA